MQNRRIEDKLNSEKRDPPSNNEEAIQQIWFALIGTNGSGLFKQFKDLKEVVETKLVTKDVCQAYHEAQDKKKANLEKIILGLVAVLSFFFGDNILRFFGG